MKVILTGPTGFIGQQVLEQCLQHPSITSVVALSRRELPAPIASNPKLKVSIVDDFLSYSDTLIHDIKGAEACIWYSHALSFETVRPFEPADRRL
jgi:uncharacterized protein YbjT (DUF2867 family)